MNSVLKRLLLILSCVCPSLFRGQAETVTWTNTAGGNWSVAANWSPNKVPAAADTAQITTPGTYIVNIESAASITQLQVGASSGAQTLRLTPSGSLTLGVTASFATNAPFEWSGGTIAGAGTFNFAGNVTLSGTGDRSFSNARLNTFGTTTWSGTGRIVGYSSATWQQSGVLNVSAPSSFVWAGIGGGPVFVNSGSVSFTTNFAFASANVTNLNAWIQAAGEISVANSNFRHAGNASLGANAILAFDSGTVALVEGPVSAPANGLRFRGGDVSLRTVDLITPSLWQSGGIVRQLTNIAFPRYNQSGGTWVMTTPSSIGTYALTNGELRGALLTATNVWWNDGGINRDNTVAGTPPVLIIPASGQLNLTGTADHGISTYDGNRPGHIQVFGSFNWSGACRLLGNYASRLELLGNSSVTAPASYAWAGFGNGPVLVNSGSLSFSTNFSFASANVTNLNAWSQAAGEIAVANSNFRHAGNASLGANAILAFDSGTVALIEGPVSAPANGLRFRAGDVSLRTIDLITPSLWQSGGIVRQLTNITFPRYNQSGGTWVMTTPSSIGTYALTNGELRGALLTATNVWWNDGGINRDNTVAGTPPVLIIPASGQLNLTGTADHGISTYDGNRPGHIQVFGSFNWSGAGRLLGNYASRLELLGSSSVTAPASYAWAGFGNGPVLVNSGSLSFATNFTFASANVTNLNAWSQAAGEIAVANSNFRHAGNVSLGANAVLAFDSGTVALIEGPVSAPANGLRFRGGDVSLRTVDLVTPSLWQSGGIVRQLTNIAFPRYNQSGGTWVMTTPSSIGTYALTNGELRGALLTATNVWWNDGGINRDNTVAGTPPVLIIPASGQLNLTGTADHGISTYDGNRPGHIQVFGSFNWSGAGRLLGNYASRLELLGNSSVTAPASYAWAGFGNGPVLVNSGSLSFATNFSFASANVTNLNAWSQAAGEIAVANSNFRHAGNASLGANAILAFDSGTVALIEGPVSAPANGLRFRAGDVSLRTVDLVTPSLWQSGGIVRQLTNIAFPRYNQSGGTWVMTTPSSIGTYALTNGELRGALLTATNVWWNDGGINRDNTVAGTPPVLIIPASGQLNLTGTADHGISTYDGNRPGHIQVFGSFNWSGAGRLLGNYASRLELLGNSSVTAPASYAWAGFGNGPVLVNSGSLSFSTNFTFASANVTNLNAWSQAAGEIAVANSNFRHAGNASLGANAILAFDSGTVALIEGPVSAPANGLRFRAGDVSLRTIDLITPSLWQSGGIVRQLTNITFPRYNQSGGTWVMTTPSSIGTYALTNGELRGALLTATNVWWNDGGINRDNTVAGTPPVLIIPASGQLNLTGTADHGISTYDGNRPGHIQVFGSFNWSGAGRLLGNYGSQLDLRGSSTISALSSFAWAGFGAGPAFLNSGSLSFSTNFSFASANVTNNGTWTLAGGTQTYSSSVLRQAGGTFSLAGGKVAGSATTSEFTGGTLSGNGEFGLPFVNNGATVAPGRNVGVLQFPSFNQTAGTLSVDVGRGIAGTNTDLIRVTGAASVAGKLKVRLLPGVGTNDQYVVLTTTARTGTFNPLEQPANGVVEAAYSTTNVVLNLKELFEGSAPTLVGQPADLTLDSGASGSFGASVTGSDPITFRWQKDGTEIPGATLTNLNVGPVSILDAAGYRLIAENDFGATTSRIARLNVRPALASNPGDVLPIARWHLDEPADSPVVLDVTPNRYDGTNSPAGITSIADGRAGRALQFNRTNNGHVNMGRVLSLGTNDFTVVAWVKSSPNANGFASYLSKHTLTYNNGYALNLNASGANGQARKASWYATTPAGSGTEPRSTTNVDDGQWHQIVATHRGDGSGNAIYVDGSPVEHSTPGALILTNTASFLLGGVMSGETPTSTFSGSLDEIAVFDRILSDAQVDYLFANPAADSVPDIAAPAIVTAPVPTFVPAGSNTNLAVTVTGTSPLAFQWFRNGVAIPGANAATLPLNNVRCDLDTGYYSARVTNSYGSVTSTPVMLGLDLPLFETDSFRAWYACSGRNPTNTDPDWDYLRVSTSKDTYHTNGAWFIDTATIGENLYWRKTGIAARFPSNGVIEFCMKMGPGSTTSGARGWVSVTFTRGDGRLATLQFTSSQVWFNTADLTAGTKVTTPTSDDFHTWRIEFNGTPGADNSVRLFKDRVQIGTGTMFADATRDEPALSFGEGSVLATGTSEWLFFRHTSSAGPALVINDQPDSLSAPFAGNAAFTVGATGNGPLRYQWRRNNTDIAGATNATLELTNLLLADAGAYTVLVADDYDSLVSNPANLTVVRPVAANITWTNTLGGNWNVASNWSPNLVPESTDTAFITAVGAYFITNTANANVLNLSIGADTGVSGPVLRGGNLIFGGTVNVGSLGALEDTTVGGGATGVLLIESGGRFTANTDRVLGAITTNRGQVQIVGRLTLNQPLVNEASGTVLVQGQVVGDSTLFNRGRLVTTGGSPDSIQFNSPLNSTGSLEVGANSTTVVARIGGSNTIAGVVTVATNATLAFGPGDHQLSATSGIRPSGRLQADSLVGPYDPLRGIGYYGRTRVFIESRTNWWTVLDNRRSVAGVGGADTLIHLAPETLFGGTNLQNGGTFVLATGSTATFAQHAFNDGLIDGTNALLTITPSSSWTSGRIAAGVATRVPAGIQWTHSLGNRQIAGSLDNEGTVDVLSGSTALLDGARWFNRTNSILNVSGATLGNAGTDIALVNDGLVAGSGNLALAITNNGTLRPGNPVGIFTVRSLTQGTAGRIELDLAAGNPGNQYDQVAVTGAAQLAGTLALTLRDGYTPTLSDVFVVVPHGSRSGTFATIENPALATLVPNYAATQVQLNITEIFTPAPVATAQPASQTVPAGAQVTLTFGVRGTAPITYEWTRNGSVISGAISQSLVLENVQPGTATYRVTASNAFGSITSDPATITVTAGLTSVPGIASPGVAGPLNSITFLNSLFGFVTGDNGAFRYTTNGGASWFSSIPGVTNKITGAAFYGGAYWISGSGGLLCVSYDGGRSWVPFNTGTSEDFTGITFDRDGTGFAVGSRGTICVYRNGAWYPASGIPTNVNFYGVYSYGGYAWAVGSGGTICYYRNGSWFAANTGGFGGTFYGVGFWDANFGIALGSGGTVCVSRNGGLSWSPLNVGSNTDFLTVTFASANVIFIGGRGGILCVSTNGGASWTALSTGTTADITSITWRDGIGYYVDSNGICRAFRYAGFVPNLPPTVRILNPTNRFTFETNIVTGTNGITTTNIATLRHDYTNYACVPIPFRAVASDPDDSVFAVEFYINGFPIDNDPANPVEHFWDNCTPGRYWLAALAVDTRGAVAYSENVAITVLPPLHILIPSIRPDGLVRLCYAGETNVNYGVEISTDLENWSYLGPFFPTNSILQYLDGPTTNAPHRLYRAIQLP